MYTTKQICSMFDVTRRTLQEYDKIGLFKPAVKDSSGWLYDDNSINKLYLIQLFREVGYERKTIMSILDMEPDSLKLELDRLINKLEDKKLRTEGMLNMARNMREFADMPDSDISAMSNIKLDNIFKRKSFKEFMDEAVSTSANTDEEDFRMIRFCTVLCCNLAEAGRLASVDPSSEKILKAVGAAFKNYTEMLREESGYSDEYELVVDSDVTASFYDLAEYILTEPDFSESFLPLCSKDTRPRIMNAVRLFCENIIS